MLPLKAFAAATLVAAMPLAAHASAELAASKNCLACHNVDKKMVGPAFKDVAAKYKGNAKAAEQVPRSIRYGSNGQWGQIPMPANQVTEAEANTLAKWILSL